MLRCFSVERQSSHGGGGGGTYIPASAPHHKTECNQNISRTSHGVRDEGCCLHRDQEGERTTCCYCGWLLCRLSRRWFIRSLVPLFSFRRLKRQCFQGRQWRRRESQLRPLQPTDGPTGFERVAIAVQCLFLLLFIQRIKKERDRIIYRSRSAIGGRT